MVGRELIIKAEERDSIMVPSSSNNIITSIDERKETEDNNILDETEDNDNILEIIEECSVDDNDNDTDDTRSSGDNTTTMMDHSMNDLTSQHNKSTTTTTITHNNNNNSGSVEFEFSLSSITFALGDVLQGSAAKLGDALAGGKLRQNNNKDLLSSSSHHSVLRAKLLRNNSNHNNKNKSSSSSRLGQFEEGVIRLRYTPDDVFDIVDDPHQFQELRNALRSMGAVTNTLIQQRLHWYVRNNKRERARQAQAEAQAQAELLLQQCQRPETPPTESHQKVMDTDKVFLKNDSHKGIILSELDPSPKSVRGIFVPSSSS
jgi:hypothetical protein